MAHKKDDSRLFNIDLDQSRAPRPFRDGQNLWREDLGRIYRLLDRQVAALTKAEEDQERHGRYGKEKGPLTRDDRPHLSIAVFGPSGSGKSSLIRTLADDVRRRFGQILPEGLHHKVATLPVMNPTTWGRTDQFLYAFLASALEEERTEQERREHGYPQGLSPVQLAFQEVNEYLRVVDEPERSEEHDPLGLSLQKLERHTSGLRLRRSLGELIEQLTKELRSEIVLLPVDDLDMAPDHLVNALQSYQSYLMHPRLVPVFTFTDRMPEELIEVHYKKQLGEAASHQRLESNNRLSISEQMAVQFLARCFPVRNRIRLGPAPARVQRANFSARTLESSGKKPQEAQVLELLTQASFLLFGHPDSEDAHQLRAALRPSTLRRQLQVADAMSDSHVLTLRTPQIGVTADHDGEALSKTAGSDKNKEALPTLRDGANSSSKPEELWKTWKDEPSQRRRLAALWPQLSRQLNGKGGKGGKGGEPYEYGYYVLARSLKDLGVGATWTTLFNRATWALLNVHRDTLRELGLFLEDLYSWSPKELRSVVLENILAQDQETRRTVVDRWFNRTDYRRSQILSLLAANVFRPWMIGEEPFGDEEVPIKRQIELEKKLIEDGKYAHSLDRDWDRPTNTERAKSDSTDSKLTEQIRERLTLPAPKGLLWFFNVTLGFYLPQVMARNWDSALEGEVPIKTRMSGNGWDLHHAATNAVRVADAKKEIFSFGTVFLDPTAFRRALELRAEWGKGGDSPTAIKEQKIKRTALRASIETGDLEVKSKKKLTEKEIGAALDRNHLLLRIWTCHGYSSGRYWAAFSLWRGLSFIGQVLEIGIKHSLTLRATDKVEVKEKGRAKAKVVEKAKTEDNADRKALKDDLFRLVRTHGLQGLSPGSLLNKNSSDERLLQAFPKWEPRGNLEQPIKDLADDLIIWLESCWSDRIFPLPAGDIWLGWKDCFIRRIHGEYVLGGLWPRLNSSYLEEYEEPEEWSMLGRYRASGSNETLEKWKEAQRAKEKEAYGALKQPKGSPKTFEEWKQTNGSLSAMRFRWSAAIAAGAWSDLLLEYWRGCPPILKMLLTCPVMFKSNDRFGEPQTKETPRTSFAESVKTLATAVTTKEEKKARDEKLQSDPRLSWLHRLGLPPETWEELQCLWKKASQPFGHPTLVPTELAIPRVRTEEFIAPGESHHVVRLEKTRIEVDSRGELRAHRLKKDDPRDPDDPHDPGGK